MASHPGISRASRDYLELTASNSIGIMRDDANPVKLEVAMHLGDAEDDDASSRVNIAAIALISLPTSIASSSEGSLCSTSSSVILNTRNKNGIPIRCPHIRCSPAPRPLASSRTTKNTNKPKTSSASRRQQLQRRAALRRRRFSDQERRRILLFQQRALSALIGYQKQDTQKRQQQESA